MQSISLRVLATSVFLLAAGAVQAQPAANYPARPVRIVTSEPGGGGRPCEAAGATASEATIAINNVPVSMRGNREAIMSPPPGCG